MKTWLNTNILSEHLGSGWLAIVKAAFIGAPLPLCSCGVIPVATQLKRSGASSPATATFLVSTPETGVDSVSVSYAMLGPVMAIYRPITAIISAIFTGILVALFAESDSKRSENGKELTQEFEGTSGPCCASKKDLNKTLVVSSSGCDSNQTAKKASTSCCASKKADIEKPSALSKTLWGLKYAFSQLIDDLIIWLLIGLLFATIIKTFVPMEFLLSYGSGLLAMVIMIAISIPMYICATASTPIAAGLILAGISPGTALVFMMAGPATNISTLGVIKNELGKSVLIFYLLGVSVSAIVSGLLLDYLLTRFNITITDQMSHSHEILPFWFSISCVVVLTLCSIKPLRKRFMN